jgi:uncharacterized protein
MSKDLIRYDLLVQDALKGVVRKVLGDAAKDGLPGEHHFYISFRTDFPGVRVSNRLREKYPQEMTIILQHQFWDLAITEHTFEVGLSFSGVPERLLIPFDSLTGFFAPSVQFGLKFEISAEAQAPAASDAPGRTTPAQAQPKRPVVPTTGRSPAPKIPAKLASDAEKPARAEKSDKPEKAKPEAVKAEKPGDKVDAAASGAEVVSLDAFRKKN